MPVAAYPGALVIDVNGIDNIPGGVQQWIQQ